jgi:branched-chain amino acid transport system ATP-binding protein
MPLLEVDNLFVSYGNVPALRGVTLQFEPGEVVSILGPNGAGKTTLLRALAGVERVKSGRATLGGRVITDLPAWRIARQGLAHVPQGRRCFSSLTVEENLMLGGAQLNRADLTSRVEEVFVYFPALLEKRRQMAGELSGGQQQMLAIGRALVSRPRVLMVDEPSLGLAPTIIKSLGPILLRLAKEEGTAVILAEQNVGLASLCSETGYILTNGRVAIQGKIVDLAPNLMEIYTGAS